MPAAGPVLSAALSLRRGQGARVGAEKIALLEAVGGLGSIRAAAAHVGLSYKGAWDAIQALNNLFDAPLVDARPGGKTGGVAELTERGRSVIAAFHRVEAELSAALARIDEGLSGDVGTLFWSLGMRTSARNALRGTVTNITDGAVNAEITLKVADGVDIVAIVTRPSVTELGLEVGKAAVALIKSSFVVLAKGDGLVTSARNQLKGRVIEREDGAVTTEVALEIADGKTITATITRESADQLAIALGEPVWALIKAPHVILAVE